MKSDFITGLQIDEAMGVAGLSVDALASISKVKDLRIKAMLEMLFIPSTSAEDYEAIRPHLALPELPPESEEHEIYVFPDGQNMGVLYIQTEHGKPFDKIRSVHIETLFDKLSSEAKRPVEPFRDLTLTTDPTLIEANDPYGVTVTNQYLPQAMGDAAKFRKGCWVEIVRNEPRPLGGFQHVLDSLQMSLLSVKTNPIAEPVTAHILQSVSSHELFPPTPAPVLSDEQIAEKAKHDADRNEFYRQLNAKKRRDANKGKSHAA